VPPRNWKMRIGDILECIDRIQRYIHGMDFNQFRDDEKTLDSVLRNLEIIGEASKHVPREVKKRHPGLPWLEMNAMRNIVIHEYHGVNHSIIWQTITEDLPALVPQLKKILEEQTG